jgi:ribose transport system permease protein
MSQQYCFSTRSPRSRKRQSSQTVVVIGGGIDLSLGAIVSMANVIIVTLMAEEPSSSRILLALGAGLGTGILAGAPIT